MRFFRKYQITRIIVNLIFLGILIILLITTLLFRDESGGIKKLRILAIAIPFLILWIILLVYCLKWDESYYRENTLRKIQHEKLAKQERQNIHIRREGIPGQIDARLHKVITPNLFWMRMLRSEKIIGLIFFFFTSFVFCFFSTLVYGYRQHRVL